MVPFWEVDDVQDLRDWNGRILSDELSGENLLCLDACVLAVEVEWESLSKVQERMVSRAICPQREEQYTAVAGAAFSIVSSSQWAIRQVWDYLQGECAFCLFVLGQCSYTNSTHFGGSTI